MNISILLHPSAKVEEVADALSAMCLTSRHGHRIESVKSSPTQCEVEFDGWTGLMRCIYNFEGLNGGRSMRVIATPSWLCLALGLAKMFGGTVAVSHGMRNRVWEYRPKVKRPKPVLITNQARLKAAKLMKELQKEED